MTLHVLSVEETRRAMELAAKPYRPREILEQQKRIEEETAVLELRASTGQEVTEDDTKKVVVMKLELDRLYTSWILGEIE